MKLMTHNLLLCNKKGCTTNNYPLKINSSNLKILNMDYDEELVKRFIKKLDLSALTNATKDLGIFKFEFENLTTDDFKNTDILKHFHHILFENVIIKGVLICPNCSREYHIDDGIPNMILKDDEI